jgi:carbon monoxide dehydrogenase subunit G
MKIENSFTVDAPVDEAWTLLTNIAEIAPCLPGANLTGEEDGVYTGTVKVKVGPVTAEYKGTAEFAEKDDVAHKAVINGKGRDSRGAGNAQALITAEMEQVGDQTRVDIVTDLKISGKVAQFGRGVMQDVSEKLLGQFADCLEAKLDDHGTAEAEVAEAHSTAATTISPPPVLVPVSEEADVEEVLDLLDVAGGAVAKRAIPTALTAAAIIAFIIWLINR